jgi:cytoskeletal protein RodZ
MSNFKSGSGNLDFGGNETDEEEDEATEETTESQVGESAESRSTDQSTTTSTEESSSSVDSSGTGSGSDQDSVTKEEIATAREQYPYFIRRNNVGDERDTRLEIHVRDKVADREAKFRNELAEQLGASEISKTDAREFALLVAFQHPDRVAELMREEGFGALD